MAKLGTGARKRLPKSEFAGPGRSFPIEDKVHAEKALQLAPRSEHAGNISKGTEERIESKARAKLGETREPRTHDEFHRMGHPKDGKY